MTTSASTAISTNEAAAIWYLDPARTLGRPAMTRAPAGLVLRGILTPDGRADPAEG